MVDFEHYSTLLVQEIGNKVGSTAPIITPSASYGYKDALQAEEIFSGKTNLPLYARVGNPTNSKLEEVMSKVENGIGAIATSSGMAALSMIMTAIISSGDKVLCIGGFFGGTFSLVSETLKRFGVKNRFCQVDDFEVIENELKKGVKIVLLESVGNPSLRLPDIKKIADLCKIYQTILVIDNTVTPILVKPLEMGVDIVIYSSTKSISGHSESLGGIAVFREVKSKDDKLNHNKYRDLHSFIKKAGSKALVAICKKRALRDFGMSANAFGSFLTLLGLETLPLRIKRVNKSVEKIVNFLDKNFKSDVTVYHPSLENSPDHKKYKKFFPQGCGPVFTIDCKTKEKAYKLLDNLKLATLTANIGDNRTLALHMASTIYANFDDKTKQYLGISDGLIRVSVGLEEAKAISEDFLQASIN